MDISTDDKIFTPLDIPSHFPRVRLDMLGPGYIPGPDLYFNMMNDLLDKIAACAPAG